MPNRLKLNGSVDLAHIADEETIQVQSVADRPPKQIARCAFVRWFERAMRSYSLLCWQVTPQWFRRFGFAGMVITGGRQCY